MHFHLPKPLHGWREFAGEVGIIVLGVLIALTAESLLEDLRWHRQVEQATDAFKAELAAAALAAYERQIVQQCLMQRLKAIADKLNEPGEQWTGMPEHFSGAQKYYNNVLPVVYRAPFRPIVSDAWQNAIDNGTINHLSAKRAGALESAYEVVRGFVARQNDEGLAETRLAPLATNRMLDANARIQMVQAVGDLDRINNTLVGGGETLLDAIRGARLEFNNGDIQKYRADVIKLQREYRGVCVRTDLPLSLD